MTSAIEVLDNPLAIARLRQSPSREPLAFHRRLPGYTPTPLLDVPVLARAMGVGSVLVKDETSRLGLPSFKILGASWAVYRALEAQRGVFAEWERIEDLAAQLAQSGLVLVAATDGNHGRAVARMARLLGLGALILVPDDMAVARRAAIAEEGAELVVVEGSYDDAVARSALTAADDRHVLVSDTSWSGYEEVPGAVIDGYSTLLSEVDDELAARRGRDPDVVFMQVGVGAFAAAVTRHYRRPGRPRTPCLVSVEPEQAACVLASQRAGRIVTLPGSQHSIMSGLNCGTPSLLAFPVLQQAVDVFCAIEDDVAREGVRALFDAGIRAGECSGGGVGAALHLLGASADPAWRARLGVGPDSCVLLFLTEGVTDPLAYDAIVGG
ncbi:MAG: diaminopropionate ammonia-lyase [Solirubrobacterales bacterium]|nr:diaminopropionate ammonia-lyase [Solirubrobacterales bacterium]